MAEAAKAMEMAAARVGAVRVVGSAAAPAVDLVARAAGKAVGLSRVAAETERVTAAESLHPLAYQLPASRSDCSAAYLAVPNDPPHPACAAPAQPRFAFVDMNDLTRAAAAI